MFTMGKVTKMKEHREQYDNAWREFKDVIYEKQIEDFFTGVYAEFADEYKEFGYPNGSSQDDMWSWIINNLTAARVKDLKEQQKRADVLIGSFNNIAKRTI